MSFLEKRVFDPKLFRGHIKEIVLCFSDQIPFWVKVKGGKQLYASWKLSSTVRRTALRHCSDRLVASVRQLREAQWKKMLSSRSIRQLRKELTKA